MVKVYIFILIGICFLILLVIRIDLFITEVMIKNGNKKIKVEEK